MIIIKDLKEFLNDAQTHMVNKSVFVNPKKNEYIVFDDYFGFDEDMDIDKYWYSEDWVTVNVNSFSRDMYLDFIYKQNDELIPEFLNIFDGKGKYRRIKNHFAIKGILNDFYKFEAEYTRLLAIEWCKNNNLKYLDD